MKGYRTLAFNALTAVASIFGGAEILNYVDAQTAIFIVAACNIGLRCITSTVVGGGEAAKAIGIVLVTSSLTACQSLPTFSTVAPTFCSLATNAESQKAARALLEKLPPGTDKDRAIEAERMAEISADAACVLVKALETRTATP